MEKEDFKQLVLDKIEQLYNELKHDHYMAIESKGEVKSYLLELKMYVKNL